MKTTLIGSAARVGAAILIAFFASLAQAATMYDGFDYTGAALDTQNGGIGWGGAWFTTSGAQPNSLATSGGSLSYPGTFESPMTTPATVGTRVSTGAPSANASTSRLFDPSLKVDLNVNTTVKYASALIRKNAANGGGVTTDNVLIEFVDASTNRRWGLGIEGTTDKPWLNANNSTQPASGPAVTPGETYFIVTKIVSGATDTAYLKVYGTGYGAQVPVLEPSTWDATQTEATAAILDRIRIRIDPGNTGAAAGEVDEIRIGDSWAEVVGAPEPSSFALFCLASLTAAFARRRN